jgi:glutaminyl-peptide cyclotransferase
MRYNRLITLAVAGIVFATSCNGNKNTQNNTSSNTVENTTAPIVRTVPSFNEDNAFAFIEKQVAFGPRVPNTVGQLQTANWLETQLKLYTDTVYRQETTLTAGDGKTQLRCINLIASINPKATKRILLLAHWDTRPWADQDSKNIDKPIVGADDGGSGTAVILEIAQTIKNTPLHNADLGIDILLADVEDYGKSEWGEDSYALGTQYWARNPHVSNYRADHGILLDMVGGKNATFRQEGFSREYAPNIVQNVWVAAYRAGYSAYFLNEPGGYIADDHVPVNRIIKIPTIDIINLPPGSRTGFVAHWHTHDDNIQNIDKNTLKAVGQTLLYYLYNL